LFGGAREGYDDTTIVTLNATVGLVQFAATQTPEAEIVAVPDRLARISHAEYPGSTNALTRTNVTVSPETWGSLH
jgi:hypothetical protein